jgi:hypothetical protein
MRALADGLELNALTESADCDCGANAGARGHLGERFVDLDGQFTSGAENDGLNAGLRCASGDVMQDRQHKRERLAGAGLRGGHQVAACEGGLDGQLLDGRWLDKTVLREIAL